jgi:hypothetical protein
VRETIGELRLPNGRRSRAQPCDMLTFFREGKFTGLGTANFMEDALVRCKRKVGLQRGCDRAAARWNGCATGDV